MRFRPLATRIVGDVGLAKDALQESWCKALDAISAFQGGPVVCRWVRRIVTNSATDIRRRCLRRREVGLDEAREAPAIGADAETLASDRETLRALRETVALLPEPYRQVIELRVERELSTSETAEQLAVSRSNVATRLNRALSLLRRRFKGSEAQGIRAALRLLEEGHFEMADWLGCVFTQTELDAEAFGHRIHHEAWQRGLHRADRRVIGDSAAWVWNLSHICFPCAVAIVNL